MTDSCTTPWLLSIEWVAAPERTCVLSGVCECVRVFLKGSHAHEQVSPELLIIMREES